MSDEKLVPALRSWLKSRDVTPPDATRSIAHVMAHLPQTRQRGRWWPLPVLGRDTVLPAAVRRTGTPLAPIPAGNGRTSIVTGRIQLMFSPAKVTLIGALVFALGGVWFIAQPFDRQEATVPAAATAEPSAATGAVHVTGTETVHSNVDVDSQERVGDILKVRGVHAITDEVASDPRVSGSGTLFANVDVYGMDGPQWGTLRIENDGGAWEGTWRGVKYGGIVDSGSAWLVGSGDYEGLTYYYSFGGGNTDLVLETEGLIFPGGAPAP
jgi:hypothetical protein